MILPLFAPNYHEWVLGMAVMQCVCEEGVVWFRLSMLLIRNYVSHYLMRPGPGIEEVIGTAF